MKSSDKSPCQRSAFDEWVVAMREWLRDVGAVTDPRVELSERFGSLASPDRGFGGHGGQVRWGIDAGRESEDCLHVAELGHF